LVSIAETIVFRPDLDFRFWPGCSGKVFFKKNQNDIILVKKKLTGYNRVMESTGLIFSFSVFFSTRPDSSPGSARFRIDPSGRVFKLWWKQLNNLIIDIYQISSLFFFPYLFRFSLPHSSILSGKKWYQWK